MPRGGKRPGAGRREGSKNQATLTKEAIRAHIQARVAAELDPMLDAGIANAKGLKYLVSRDPKTGKFERIAESELAGHDGVVEVWEKDPSVQALTDLLNRAADKPKEQPQDVDIKGELVIKWADE